MRIPGLARLIRIRPGAPPARHFTSTIPLSASLWTMKSIIFNFT
jgi:hypothetical protein